MASKCRLCSKTRMVNDLAPRSSLENCAKKPEFYFFPKKKSPLLVRLVTYVGGAGTPDRPAGRFLYGRMGNRLSRHLEVCPNHLKRASLRLPKNLLRSLATHR